MIHNYLLPLINDIKQISIYLIAFVYLLIILWLALYGINNLVSAILYLRIKKTIRHKNVISPPKEWPLVTIQLPIFNEKYTVERLLSAVIQLDYPADVQARPSHRSSRPTPVFVGSQPDNPIVLRHLTNAPPYIFH